MARTFGSVFGIFVRAGASLGTLAASLVLGASASASPSPCDAPGRSVDSVLARASDDLHRFVQLAGAPRGTVGAYVAIDPSWVEVTATVACDDDGDPVVVLSKGFLAALDDIALLAAAGEDGRVEAWGHWIRDHGRGAYVPLPPGWGGQAATRADAMFRTALRAVVAHEIVYASAEIVLCPRPTPTRERGDREWTVAERRAAVEMERLHTPARETDADAAVFALDPGLADDAAYAAWLRFLAAATPEAGRPAWGVVRSHPGAGARLTRPSVPAPPERAP